MIWQNDILFLHFLGTIYIKHLHDQYKFDIKAITPEFLKNAFGLHDLPTRLISIGGKIVPFDSTFLVPNETYTLNTNINFDDNGKETRAAGK